MKLKTILIAATSLFLAVGCGSTRVVFVDTQSNLVRLGPNVEGKIYVLKNGVILSKNKVKLPEGWYAGGLPTED